MPRRVSLPGADELFRSTSAPLPGMPPATPDAASPDETLESAGGGQPSLRPVPPAAAAESSRAEAGKRPSRRQRHDEKITVYVSAAELVDLEKARLTLRADHGLGVDRGRIVREALSVVLADLDAKGEQSILVRRLRSS